jgi:hypothetical protein
LFAGTAVAVSLQVFAGGEREFTVADDIGLSRFVGGLTGPWNAPVESFSPNGKYFVAVTERGLLKENSVQDTISVFEIENLRRLVTSTGDRKSQLQPVASAHVSARDAGAISELHWLEDSSGLVFLGKTPTGKGRVALFDVRALTLVSLTPDDQDVTGFDFRAGKLLYTVRAITLTPNLPVARSLGLVGTEHELMSLLFPEQAQRDGDVCELWTSKDGQRSRLENVATHEPIYVHQSDDWEGAKIALSPNGRLAVARLAVADVPKEWESYAAQYSAYRIRAGKQDVQSNFAPLDVESYFLINLDTGLVRPLVDAPIGQGYANPYAKVHWSATGEAVLLPDTFLPLNGADVREKEDRLRRPCVVVVAVGSGAASCVTTLRSDVEARESLATSGPGYLKEAHFDSLSSRTVVGTYAYWRSASTTEIRYRQRLGGSWTVDMSARDAAQPIDVRVRQSLDEPPVLVAGGKRAKEDRVFWDPNPQLRGVALGKADLFRWSDSLGRQVVGALIQPPGFVSGKRYPLVIQTHGFAEGRFITSGSFTSAFAARELAAAGILVLQIPDCAEMVTPDEAACNVEAYEAAVEKLVATGVADPERVGIIGFSRTCYYVMTALAGGKLRFAAASINDGVNFGYLQYLAAVDSDGNSLAREAEALFGSAPFGAGLSKWLKLSPEFNMDRVTTPLRVEAVGPADVLFMWEPYAALRYLHRPVDLIVLEDGTHPLTNPTQRLISQGGSVDWFRFWLQGYEDPDPAKTEQYQRWEKLCNMRAEQNQNEHAFCVRATVR